MKIKITILAMLASARFFTANAAPVTATDHQFDPAAPDVNKYNLDMTQDTIDPQSFLYSRWGLLCDQEYSDGRVSLGLKFDYLTALPQSPDCKDLFVLSAGILPDQLEPDQFELYSFQNQVPLPSDSSDWIPATGPPSGTIWDPILFQPGQLVLTSPQAGNTYFLFRKYHFSPVLVDFHGTHLDQNTSKLVIMIHGWNPDQNRDSYQEDADLNNLGTAINNQISGTDWKIACYHWEVDADTGPIILGTYPYNYGAANGAEAAEAGYLHGLHLGQVLLNNYTNVQKIHLIAHSAGAWCARTAAKYLMQRNPGIKVEVTLLDPFVPGDVHWNDWEPFDLPSSSLTTNRINDLQQFGNSTFLLENYYSDDGEWVDGTQSSFWGGIQGVDWSFSAINEQVGTSVANVPTWRYGGHSGPIQFYSDTVSNTLPASTAPPIPANLAAFSPNLQQIGWWRSMFLDEAIIDQQPQSVTSATQGQPVSFTVHATTRRQQRGYPAPGLNMEYSWQKYDNASGTWQTAYGSSLGATYSRSTTIASDAGQYRVIADNGAGGAISQIFILSFDNGSGSPQISLQSPVSGATVSGTVPVTTSVAASVGIVSFCVDGVPVSTNTAVPFSWSWNSTQTLDGLHTLTANAYDNLLGTWLGVSAPVTVTVSNGAAVTTSPDPYEPNDSSSQAALLGVSTNIQAYISSPTDVDWFKVSLTNFGTLQLNLTVPAGKDFDLELYGPNGTWLAGSYNPAGYAESIRQSVTSPGTYYFRVYGYPLGAGSYSASSPYSLSTSFVPQTTTNIVSGGVTNSTWSGVVNLTGDVTIGSGSVLTILPGTIIQCQPDTDTQAGGANSSRVEIILNGGTINAVGTVGAPIVFTSAGPVKTPGDWYGIRIIEGDITMNNSVVEYASDGIRFEDSDTRFNTYALGNVTVQRCSSRGVYVVSGQYAAVTLNNFTLWTNSIGLQSDGGPVTLVGGLVTGNSGNGINCGPLTATGTTVSQNGSSGISGGTMTLSGCVVSQNGSTGIGGGVMTLSGCTISKNNGTGVSGNGGTLTSCVVVGNHADGVDANAALQMTGCTLLSNNGWGLNTSPQGSPVVEVWNNLVQSNGSGGLYLGQGSVVGVVSNTISGNLGNGLNLSMSAYCNYGCWSGGVGPNGITGNAIYNNGGVGVEVQASQPSVLTISGNDIYQNTTFELRNDSSITVIANGNYWSNPTGTELSQGRKNLSRIYDILDGGPAEVLVANWYASPFSGGNPGPLQTFTESYSGATQVSGTIGSGQTWSGTVLLVGDVTVAGSLTIMPGTTVLFDALHDNQASGSDRSRCELIVNGTFIAAGTPGAPILFTSSATTKTPGDWYGIRVTAGDVTISNCVVEYATDGIRFENPATAGNTYALGNVTVQRCSSRGVYVVSGQYAAVTLNNFTLWTNSIGLQSDGGPVTLVGGLVTGNSGNGINCGPLTATGTTVSQNGSSGISGGTMTLSGCVVSQNGSTGIGGGVMTLSGCTISKNNGTGVSGNGGTLTSCVVVGNHADGVDANAALQMTGCTLLSNNGWGLNTSPQGSPVVEVWNNLVQSNGSGGLYLGQGSVVGVVSNTISGNLGNGLNLSMSAYCNYGCWSGGVGPNGITGNAIYNNGGVGVEVQASQPSVLTISGNDIYQNTTFELRNDSSITVIANGNYWSNPTGTELSQGRKNLSRIYDILDGGPAEVLVANWYASPFSGGNPGPLQTFTESYSGATQVSGTIGSGQTWSGTVLLVGDVTVAGSLTIMPGTTVLFDALHDNQASGSDRSRCELIVNGTFIAAGTPGAPILFTSSATTKTPGDWYGIRVTAGDVTISNCVVEYATDGIRFENPATAGNTYALGNVTVQRCSSRGVYVVSGQYAAVTLNNFTLWTNSIGLQSDGGPVTLVGGLVTGNSGNGINCGPLTATGTTVSQNGSSGISGGTMTLSGCVVSQNGSTGIGGGVMTLSGCTISKNNGTGVSGNGGTLTSCVVVGNHADGVDANAALQMTGCTLLSNNGWGLNTSPQGSPVVEVWNNLVQSNGSGGLYLGQGSVVGVVSNTISGNLGNGLNLSMSAYCNYGCWSGGVGPNGITGNAIYNNGGVGVEVQASQPSVLTISGNDIYQNTTFELRNDSSITVIAPNEYWGQPTTGEVNAGQVNLSRIYDSHDNAGVGQVLVGGIRTTPMQYTLMFVRQPQSVTPNVGDTVTLSPVVSGAGPISYQWFDNGLLMPQGTNLTLTMPGVTVGDSGGYFLVISNATGTAISSVAFVAVILPPGAPTISQQPQPRSVLAGSPVSFTVVAAGNGPFGYQWQKDSVAINGATSSTYTIAAVSVNDTGAYSVIVTNSGGSTPSQAATLTVNVLSGSAINRSITTNGSNFAVSLVVSPPVGTPAYMVEEVLPAGFSPNNISSSGSWDATSRTITWGPFWDGLPRSFTYTLIPPSGFSGTASITGQALLFGATATTGGDSTVSVGPPPMNPILALVKIAPGLYGVSVTGEIGRTYRIDAADDLGSGAWSPVITVVVTQSPFTVADLGSVNKHQRFYRVTVIQ